ncbi:recombinase family protein [Garciella nitratireducens]|uniref:recombinase family protein n=1 Tax=Garciella nitratireducens TaxID=218205 RepID=UPI001BD5F5BF|nr:recombinase family protein [Garciella nitratireducens]
MGHTPFGYRIEDGKAVVDDKAAEQVKELFSGYLSGLSLKNAAIKAGLDCYHATAGKMLQNKRYLGDEFYPPIIDEKTFEKARVEKRKRAEKLGRIWEPKDEPETDYPVKFKAKPLVQKYDDPYKQAEYAYSLIESEV